MNRIQQLVTGFFLLISAVAIGQNRPFSLEAGRPVPIVCDTTMEEKVVKIALELFSNDCLSVLSSSPEIVSGKGSILLGTIGQSSVIQGLIKEKQLDISEITGKNEAFLLTVLPDGRLVIAGSDKRGTAYGLLELSRLLGVSPWEWWADSTPEKQSSVTLPAGYRTVQSPSVEYRGIFLNDEDWGLLPWSNQTYEPSDQKNHIGPRTYSRIFELLLRLRANTLWPAMHECTLPFFLTEGNRQAAADYSIFIGSSHCEPMVCNAAGEWSRRGTGDYDYVNNSANVFRFWEQRIKEVAGQDNIYTLGMRGVHDGKMQGANTIEEQKAVLVKAISDQRRLLKEHVQPDISQVPQVFIPYKEVLDIYNSGLEVPEDVTLMWCDDNYGYIRHFPTMTERNRKGGNGMYYHVSYWGRPHDYLWLSTMQPALVYQQMKLAFEQGIQKMWILNVGDIKPAEYHTELFLDMAWDFDRTTADGVNTHLENWLKREFGSQNAAQLLPVMLEHYRLAHIRKPEFMGNTREEERDPVYKIVKDLPWSEKEIKERLQAYDKLSEIAEKTEATIPENKRDAYFELIKYPVLAAAQMNHKLLQAQLARHNKSNWELSDLAYDSIVALTQQYNTLKNGKWNRMMDHRPRKLPVFNPVKHESATSPLPEFQVPVYQFNGADFDETTEKQPSGEGLGYEKKAQPLIQGSSVSFHLPPVSSDSILVEVRLLPNHPVDGDKLRFTLSLDNQPSEVVEYQTKGRSEEWKENILRNQAIRRLMMPVKKNTVQKLRITAIDKGVVLDQVVVSNK